MKKHFRFEHQQQNKPEMCDHQEKGYKHEKTPNSKSQQAMQSHYNQGHRYRHYHHHADDNKHNKIHSTEDIRDRQPSHQNQRDYDKSRHHHPHHCHHKLNNCHDSESTNTSLLSSSSSATSSSSTSSLSNSSFSSSLLSSSSSTVSSSSSSLSSEGSSECSDRHHPRRPQHSQSFTDISVKHKYFEEDDDTAPLINARGRLNRSSAKQRRDTGKFSLNGPTKENGKKHSSTRQLGNDGSFRKAKSMDDLTTPTDKAGDVTENGSEHERSKSEARENVLKEKMKFSAFLNEITRQVLSPMRLSSLGVTDTQRPHSPGRVACKSGEKDIDTDKPKQWRSQPTSPDSISSSKHSYSSQLSRSKSFHHHEHRSASPASNVKHRSRSCHSCSPSPERLLYLSPHKLSRHRHREECNNRSQSHQYRNHHHQGHHHNPAYKRRDHHSPVYYSASHLHKDKCHKDPYSPTRHDKHHSASHCHVHHEYHHNEHTRDLRDNCDSNHYHDDHNNNHPNSYPTTPCHFDHRSPTSNDGTHRGLVHQHHHGDHHREAHQRHPDDHHLHHESHHSLGHHQHHNEAHQHHYDDHKEASRHNHRDHHNPCYWHPSQHHHSKSQEFHHSPVHPHLHGNHQSKHHPNYRDQHNEACHHHHRDHHSKPHPLGEHHRDLHSPTHYHHNDHHHSETRHHDHHNLVHHYRNKAYHHPRGDQPTEVHRCHQEDQQSEVHHNENYYNQDQEHRHEDYNNTSHCQGWHLESQSHSKPCKPTNHDNNRLGNDPLHSADNPASHRKPESLVSKNSSSNTNSFSRQAEEQTSFTGPSTHEEKTHELGRIMILQDQNEGLHQSLLKTAVQVECLGEEFISSQKLLEADLQRTRMELSSLMEKFQRLQDDCSSTQQTNNLLEKKLHSMLQNMEGERERLNQRISELTEQLTDATIATTMEAINVAEAGSRRETQTSLPPQTLFSSSFRIPRCFPAREDINSAEKTTSMLHKSSVHSPDDALLPMVPPITPPPAQFMDSHNYGQDKSSGQEQPLGSVPEEEESDWSEVGEETPRLLLTGSSRGPTWRRHEADVDKDCESESEELIRRHFPRPLQIPHLQFTIHNEFLPPAQTTSCPSSFNNRSDSNTGGIEEIYMTTTSPSVKSAILIRSASLEEISLTRHLMQKELRGTEAMMNLHHSADEVMEDLDDEIIHHWSSDRDTVIRRLKKSTGAEAEGSMADLRSAEQMLNHFIHDSPACDGADLGRAEAQGWAGGMPGKVLNVERTQL